MARYLERLDQPVGGRPRSPDAAAQPVDRLVVLGDDARAVAEQPARERAVGRGDRVPVAVVERVPAGGREVLVQRAAVQHVQQLGAAADADHRQPRAQRLAQRGEVAQVARQVGLADVRADRRAVEAGMDVGLAAAQHEAVGAREVQARLAAGRRPHARAPTARSHAS